MASGTLGELNIKIAANVAQLTQDVTKVEREMRKMRNAGVNASKQMNTAAKAITGFKKLAVGVVAVTAAWRTLSRVVGSSIEAFQTQEDAEKTLETALGGTNQALLDQAAALQKVTVFGDEAIIGAQALIGSFIKDEEQIKKATAATLDLAQAKGMDLKAAADLMSKTLGSSTNAMSRYGIEVKGAVGSTERLESLTGNIARVFGGQAAAAAETMAGRTTQMSNAFGDLQEVLISFVAPALTSFAETMTPIIAQIGDFLKRMKEAREEAKALHGDFGEGGLFGMDETQGEAPQQLVETRARLEKAAALLVAREEAEEKRKLQTEQRALDLQARIDLNGKFIEEEQKLWDMELSFEANLNKAAQKSHDEEMKRKADELKAEQLLLNQKREALRQGLNAFSVMAQAAGASFEVQKKIAAASALVNAYLAISDVWADDDTNYYVKLAKVASAASQVFGVVRGLKGVSIGGGGGSVATSAPAIGGVAGPGTNLLGEENLGGGGGQTTIVFQGGTFIGGSKDEIARDLVPGIEKALQDGAR